MSNTGTPEFVRQGIAFATIERRHQADIERAAWEKAQAAMISFELMSADEIDGIRTFDLWHLI